jgi:hypothetical protein
LLLLGLAFYFRVQSADTPFPSAGTLEESSVIKMPGLMFKQACFGSYKGVVKALVMSHLMKLVGHI